MQEVVELSFTLITNLLRDSKTAACIPICIKHYNYYYYIIAHL